MSLEGRWDLNCWCWPLAPFLPVLPLTAPVRLHLICIPVMGKTPALSIASGHCPGEWGMQFGNFATLDQQQVKG